MLLSLPDFKEYAIAIQERPSAENVGVDFETKGLNVHKGARAFLLGVSNATLGEASVWLQNEDPVATRDSLKFLFSNKNHRYCAHGWKFEGSFFKHQFDVPLPAIMWDTEVMERVRKNNHLSYSLQSCAEREGLSKYPPMAEWLKANGHKKNCSNCEHYAKAPTEIIIPYVEQDAYLSRFLAEREIEQFKHWDTTTPVPVKGVVALELKTTPVLLEIESRGIRVNIDYCREALKYEQSRADGAKIRFKEATGGTDFVDSAKCLKPIFISRALPFGKTETGQASFKAEVLLPLKGNPIVDAVTEYRDAKKRASSYWENFIEFACPDGRIHPDIHQTGAKTSRMTVRDPACQTWSDDDDSPTPYPIRRAFEADPDCFILSMDWRQMELVLQMDEAGEMDRMEDFRRGADFHRDVATTAQVPRPLAKNGRFCKGYGGGVKKIASTLGCSLEVARRISDAIDEQFPQWTRYSRELIRYAEQTGMGYNWLGRRYFFDRRKEYLYMNYRIQGGCGEIMRIAMIDIDNYLKANCHSSTRILMTIHDEFVFNWHRDDLKHVKRVSEFMVTAFKSKKHLDMEVSVTIGPNFFDLEPYKEAV